MKHPRRSGNPAKRAAADAAEGDAALAAILSALADGRVTEADLGDGYALSESGRALIESIRAGESPRAVVESIRAEHAR